MVLPEEPEVLAFDDFELNLRARTLRKNGQNVPLSAKVYDTLAVLAKNHGRVVEKDELLRSIWPDTVVEEGNLHHYVSALRRVLGEKPDERRYIATVPGRGYSFVAVVRTPAKEPPKRGKLTAALVAAFLILGAAVWLWIEHAKPSRTGAVAVPLTAAPGRAESPTFSPDARQVAFAWRPESGDGQHIYVKTLGSEGMRQLTSGPFSDTAPSWSPDGRLIAFYRWPLSGGSLVHAVIPAAGGEPRTVYAAKRAQDLIRDAWTPDGKELIFVDRDTEADTARLFALAWRTGQVRRVTAPSHAEVDICPAVSPDGKWLAFLRTHGRGWTIMAMPLEGGAPRTIAGVEFSVARAPLAWERDSKHVIYRAAQGGLWEAALSGRSPQRLPFDDSAVFPAVSARGDLAFVEPLQHTALRRFDVPQAGAVAAQTTVLESTRSILDPQWSPDGSAIAFYSDRSGATEIWTCNRDGTGLRQLTHFRGPFTRNPRWSSDGHSIAFDSVSNGFAHIHVIPTDGAPGRVLTSGHSLDIIPAWSNDAKILYFTSVRSGRWEIWTVPAQGGTPSQVTSVGAFFFAVSGNNFYYVREPGGTTLCRMNVNGGPEETVVDSDLAMHSWWAVDGNAVFYIDRNFELRKLDLATRSRTLIASFRRDEVPRETTIAAAGGANAVLVPLITRSMSDVMVAERFWK